MFVSIMLCMIITMCSSLDMGHNSVIGWPQTDVGAIRYLNIEDSLFIKI